MPENNSNKTMNVSTVVIIILSIVIALFLIFGVILFVVMNSNKNKDTQVNTDTPISSVKDNEDDNKVSNDTKTSENKPEASNQVPTTNLSNDWKSGEFALNNKNYKLLFDYTILKDDGWSFNLADYGYSNGYIMNKGDKVTGTIHLKNPNYDSDVTIGIMNNSDTPKDITQCKIWTIDVDNAFADKPVSFTLPNGIHNGSTLEDVKKAYGKPKDTYRSDSLGYWNYTYQDEYSKYFKLTIYDDKGVTAFSYDIYK